MTASGSGLTRDLFTPSSNSSTVTQAVTGAFFRHSGPFWLYVW